VLVLGEVRMQAWLAAVRDRGHDSTLALAVALAAADRA
jgi:hypothetical protein